MKPKTEPKMLREIENIHVGSLDSSGKAAASWTTPKARYHIWFNVNTNTREGWIYKNPRRHITQGTPGFYYPRQLDATMPKNVQILSFVFGLIAQSGLIAAARAARRQE